MAKFLLLAVLTQQDANNKNIYYYYYFFCLITLSVLRLYSINYGVTIEYGAIGGMRVGRGN
jgi:hypothetical protein